MSNLSDQEVNNMEPEQHCHENGNTWTWKKSVWHIYKYMYVVCTKMISAFTDEHIQHAC